MDLGMTFPRELDPQLMAGYARRLDEGGVDELWVIEDCFYTAGMSLAATALTHSERLTVGLGIIPAVLRNPALLAMEVATLARLAPGRLIAGIGHGVQEWMDQIGARPASPLTALTEVVTAVRRLLAGERLSVEGVYVTWRDVALDPAPEVPPPVIVGARGPKSLAAAGARADGLLLAELTGPSGIVAARRLAGVDDRAVGRNADDRAVDRSFAIHAYSVLSVDDDRRAARRRMAATLLDWSQRPSGMFTGDFADEMRAMGASADRSRAVEQLVDAPDDWWIELGAVGDPDDVVAHLGAMADAGAASVALIPSSVSEVAAAQLEQVCAETVPAFRAR